MSTCICVFPKEKEFPCVNRIKRMCISKFKFYYARLFSSIKYEGDATLTKWLHSCAIYLRCDKIYIELKKLGTEFTHLITNGVSLHKSFNYPPHLFIPDLCLVGCATHPVNARGVILPLYWIATLSLPLYFQNMLLSLLAMFGLLYANHASVTNVLLLRSEAFLNSSVLTPNLMGERISSRIYVAFLYEHNLKTSLKGIFKMLKHVYQISGGRNSVHQYKNKNRKKIVVSQNGIKKCIISEILSKQIRILQFYT
ncbi:hypothetical protein EGR_02189 [Echinococcus granulosus]|uniref:Uncharacterized protein n=1 Tax=Echinococcus granulosus TaxID=6210 RepID=W6UNC4_ECHGR|nr:hypothetical protein EGR_02189 [Echinococcus granulosus]EUB63095.1 hypothetical protein EGR_02189 [Echinococcus granulosus]